MSQGEEKGWWSKNFGNDALASELQASRKLQAEAEQLLEHTRSLLLIKTLGESLDVTPEIRQGHKSLVARFKYDGLETEIEVRMWHSHDDDDDDDDW